MPNRREITRQTYIKDLPLSVMRGLALLLDRPLPTYQDWRGMAALLPRRPGSEQPKYNRMQISRFEQTLHRPGGSPTEEVLEDWGTTMVAVSDLLKVLAQMEHYAAMDAVLPGSSEEYIREMEEAAHHHQAGGDLRPAPNVPPLTTQDQPPRPTPDQPPPTTPGQPPRPTPDQPPPIPPRMGTERRPVESTEPAWAVADSFTSLPAFDPQIVTRFKFEEVQQMTNYFDERPVKDGGSMIDRGGFGVVYRGRFSQGEPCAIKKLKNEQQLSEVANIEEQFDAELKALCRLKHPNLVILYGYCYETPNLCLVYELMTGGSLRDRLACKNSTAPLTWPKRVNISWGAALGIKFLHDKGYIHRDIKSGNILLDTNLTARVCDFGLVRDRSKKLGAGITHFQTEVTIGSTAYMAPEAHYGEYSLKSDVYSFGLVLLEILTGFPVYDETHILTRVDNVMEKHKDDVTRLLDQLAHSWDGESVNVVYKLAMDCTERKSRSRPDMATIAQRLEDLQGATPSM